MKLEVLNVEVNTTNEKEESLVRVINGELERVVKWLKLDDEIGRDIKARYGQHYIIDELKGMMTALFFMDMVEHPITTIGIYKACCEAAGIRKAA